MKRLNTSGSHLVAVAVGVLVVGVVAFAGYTVVQRQNKTEDTTATVSSSKSDAITTTADLDATVKTLDSSSSQVDSSLNDSSLDADLNDLL